MSPSKLPRPATYPDRRDEHGPKSATPPKGYPPFESPIPQPVDDYITENYNGDERQARRENRSDTGRIRKLESFKDHVLLVLPPLQANVQQIYDWMHEDREAAAKEREQQVELEKVRLTSRTSVVIAVVTTVGGVVGLVAAMLAKGML